jgi:hypothetical protein
MADWVLPNCTDYASWSRAAGAEENRQLKQLVADLSLDNRNAEAANASGCAQKKGTVLKSNSFAIKL